MRAGDAVIGVGSTGRAAALDRLHGPVIACWIAVASSSLACARPSVAPAASTSAVVTVTPHEDGVRAVYELPQATQRLALARSDALRRDEWRVVGAGVRLVGDTLVADQPRSTFEVVIPPDSQERDRVYPSLHRVGGGVALYGPALGLEGIDTELVLRPAAGGVAIPEQGAERGYAWLGPGETVTRGDGFRLVAGESVAPWLVEHVRREAALTLAYYERELERAGRAPTFLVSMQSTRAGGYRGDASGTAVVSLRFFDPRWNEPDPGAAADLARFVRHEAFHLWNGDPAPHAPAWLHEGGAEYAAIVAAVDAGALTHEKGLEQVSYHLEHCRAALGERALASAQLSGSQIYWCGVALQWIADMEARAGSGGERDTFAIWRDLLGRGGDLGYSLGDLRAVTGATAAAMLDDEGPGRWARLADALAGHGVTIRDAVDDDGWRSATLQHLLAQHCQSGRRGFYTEADFVRLDTPEGCGALTGNPEISLVAGASIIEAPRKAFEAVRGACEAKRTVALTTRAGKSLVVACTQPLEPPVRWTIVAAPQLGR